MEVMQSIYTTCWQEKSGYWYRVTQALAGAASFLRVKDHRRLLGGDPDPSPVRFDEEKRSQELSGWSCIETSRF
ncbi:hypothetical protein DL89DRAFT_264457 [Linderina pennispora]|uniref:Uncharacterized protein n=1 Tax=Linderina pennispora TaxID=61395 RepID=A0A1Y1WN45_9FUNG|nr:uncharacterized protein DL89DRAFT_264457 [Linderina pennispora]ORX74636.1 hypothetical protein DL89DRAFT_264457 [Linderina pennispora]